MVCKNCGIANSDNSRFCSECGSALPRPKPKEETTAQAAPQTAAPAVQTVVYQPGFGGVPPMPSFAYVPSMPAGQAFAAVPQAVPAFGMPSVQAAVAPPEQGVGAAFGASPSPQGNGIPFTMPAQENSAFQATLPKVSPTQQHIPAQPMPQAAPVPPLPGSVPYSYGGMPPYPFYPYLKDPNASKITWALVLGILAAVIPFITCSFGSPLGLVAGIIAVCLAGGNMNKVFAPSKSKAVAALVVSIIGLINSLVGSGIMLRALTSIGNGGYLEEFNEYFDSFIAYWFPKIMKIAAVAVKSVMNQIGIMLRFLLLK